VGINMVWLREETVIYYVFAIYNFHQKPDPNRIGVGINLNNIAPGFAFFSNAYPLI
jgi:hypothetical protein